MLEGGMLSSAKQNDALRCFLEVNLRYTERVATGYFDNGRAPSEILRAVAPLRFTADKQQIFCFQVSWRKTACELCTGKKLLST